ncbi:MULTISPECIES: hypothetical protein [Amycolatopsis]|uniref:Uncharacterized protein n=1 Tax=Amycolatopsis dendrobii TaxID=2760662 RepID=A0A7W3W3I4_9PSEU|nr:MULTISPECIES: hypothetical protein [Amycolatopsis]MBB1158059.1 hypothetical protein [Amycolatopsis dendrobii]UKD57147.1 hypothetical protein L3Q65_10610 [Amycolatopsis sp. FU40]
MPQTTETIDELRARLATLSGPARTEPLGSLAQKLFQRMTTAPLDSLSARTDLDEAIQCADEVYGHHREGDPQRPQVAAFLGYLLAFRTVRTGDGTHRPRAVELLEEAIEHGRFQVSYLAILRLVLAMLLFTGAQNQLTGMVTQTPADLLSGRRSPAALPDIDRAEELLHTVCDTDGVSADVSEMADLLLQLCDLMKAMLGLGDRPLDLSSMQNLFARFTELQARMANGGAGFSSLMRKAIESGAGVLNVRPDEVPVIIVEDAAEESPAVARAEAPAEVPPQPVQAELLQSLVASLSLDGRRTWRTAAELLLPDTAPPTVESVDTAIALASEVLESETAELSEEDTAFTHFAHAVALRLRRRADPDGDGSDCELGARALLSAARALPIDHPELPVVLRCLGAFLPPERPLAGLDALAAGFTGRLDALLGSGNLAADRAAELHALRCACRTAFAAAELRKAVEGLPAGYPWPVSLKAAAQPLA